MFNPFRAKTVRQAPSTGPLPEKQLPAEPTPPAFAPEPLPQAARPLPPLPPPPVMAPPPPASRPGPPAGPASVAVPTAFSPDSRPLSTAAATALEQLVAKLPGLLFAGLTEVETGTAIRGRTPSDLLPAAAVARYHADLIRLERQALKAAQGAAPEVLREMLVTMSDQLHLMRLVRDGELLLSIVLDPRLTALPTARMDLQAAANIIG